MAQRKAHEVDRWLARPDAGIGIVLLYGPDRGLVSERARAFAVSTRLPLDDPFAVIRIDAVSDDDAAGRLMEEADTIGMFGGDRLIWLKGAGAQKPIADAIASLTIRPPAATRIVIEAGDLKKAASLRAIVEDAASGMALPCFPDDERAVDGLIDEILGQNGQTIDPEARRLLKRNLGADRLASRAEVEKLTLYARGQKTITMADVVAAVGDASAVSVDDVVDAILAGSRPAADRAMRKLAGAGSQAQQALAACIRQFQALQAMRGEVSVARRRPNPPSPARDRRSSSRGASSSRMHSARSTARTSPAFWWACRKQHSPPAGMEILRRRWCVLSCSTRHPPWSGGESVSKSIV